MAEHRHMASPILQLANAFILRTHDDQLLSMSEGFVKVRCMETALALGWTIQEGAGQIPSGPIADFGVMVSGTIRWSRASRRLTVSDGSADLSIVAPYEILLEIKARPDWGTKSQAQFQQMDADVARIASNPQCAFFFVFDPNIYRSFSGEKIEKRGRNAVASSWFIENFPKVDAIPSNEWLHIEASRDRQPPPISMIARRCSHTRSNDTVFILGWRSDASFGLRN